MNIISHARKKSLWMFHVGCSGCNACTAELSACFGPGYDMERYGIRKVDSPEYADILVVTGSLNEKSRLIFNMAVECMCKPMILMAVGNCACSGGVFQQKNGFFKTIGGIEEADVYIPGCPPEPKAIIDGFLIAMQKNGDNCNDTKSKTEDKDTDSTTCTEINEPILKASNSENKKSGQM